MLGHVPKTAAEREAAERDAAESWHVAARAEEARAEAAQAMRNQAAQNVMRATDPEVARGVMWQTVSISNFFRRRGAPKEVAFSPKEQRTSRTSFWSSQSSFRSTRNRWLEGAIFARDPASASPEAGSAVLVTDEMLTAAFNKMDRRGCGKINLHQLAKAMRKCGLNVSRTAIRRVLHHMDIDPDQPLSVQDFIRFFRYAESLDAMANPADNSVCMMFCLFANLIVLCVFVMLFIHADEEDEFDYQMKMLMTVAFAVIVCLLVCTRVVLPICNISAPTVHEGVKTVATEVRHVMPAKPDKSPAPETFVNFQWESPTEYCSPKENFLDSSRARQFDANSYRVQALHTTLDSARSYRSKALHTTLDDPFATRGNDDVSILRAAANMPDEGRHSAARATVVSHATSRERSSLQQYDPQAYRAAFEYNRNEVVPGSWSAFSRQAPPAVVVCAPSSRR